ncbi:DUF1343 domain-containing protein [Maribacter polysaccharolyticus]|uniref:exo-beta-N-acetylmuramidase NamZ family protein n=1 Tax=Maribacter polysaccharolyticus TaxID=3020831 RepID=UPI00237EFEB7|nr:DUF1343 domain-containing protein [Maribacter polysaccharolyticus]MDE3741031.1 DUF1343 domain-containing protein [Maribacter polysaccharolyticus]
MPKIKTGLDVLVEDYGLQREFPGQVALLCHNASVNSSLEHATLAFKKIFSDRFVKIFGPQHGFCTDAQDNMIETAHNVHPYFNIPVYSLYSETRVPTEAMLEGVDHLFIDLQDVGCRMYTYIYTMTLILEACVSKDIEIIILDRPNPLNGMDLEGNILNMDFTSFIGRHPIPVRHGMTIGEVALMHQKHWTHEKANLRIVAMQGWKRDMFYEDTGLPWLLPSPNLSRIESAFTFPGIVLFEGTKLSEGRGTTQPLEIMGHPSIEPYGLWDTHLSKAFAKSGLEGVAIRPINFLPTFQKQANVACGGFQMHVLNRKIFKPWRTGQWLMRELYKHMDTNFEWLDPPYEYDYDHMPIDIINGTDKLRKWVVSQGSMAELDAMENLSGYQSIFSDIKLYT